MGMKKTRKTKYTSLKDEQEPIERTNHDWMATSERLKKADLRSIEEFYINNDIPHRTFYDAINKFPCMTEAHAIAKVRIGLKKEQLCEDKMLGMNTVLANQLPQYLDRWKEDIAWRNQLKTEIAKAHIPTQVIYNSAPVKDEDEKV